LDHYFAHSKNKANKKHRLADHLESVGKLVRCFTEGVPWIDEAILAGQLHDLGKYGDLFQLRLQGKAQGVDHWSAGAWTAIKDHRAIAAAMAIDGHHIGLQYLNKENLKALDPKKLSLNHPLQLRVSENDISVLKSRLESDGIVTQSQDDAKRIYSLDSGIGRMLDIRMLFSALVDADFLDTEAHFNGDEKGKCYRESGPALKAKQALEIVLAHIEDVRQETKASANVFEVRNSLLTDCLTSAKARTGLFTITAPTGSGKTLAMLAFALKHALENNLRRVVMVIPYLSIIEQTAAIYRSILAPKFGENYVLEHHSLARLGAETDKNVYDNEGEIGEKSNAERQRRLLSENWDAPIILTTSVQMLESLFSNRPSACRKLHRLAQSVILFDEVQTLPAGLAVPTLAALSHLAGNYNSTVVFATATQPAFEHLNNAIKMHCEGGWRPSEIVSEPASIFKRLSRVKVEWGDPDNGIGWAELAKKINQNRHVLCVVNLKRHAQRLWECLDEKAFHLSTNMCPAHRIEVLNTVKESLNSLYAGKEASQPVRLVATQCVEAGVDVDFPVVYRVYAPLDSIIQAAGRCNREGRQNRVGQVHVFQPLIEHNEREFPDHGYNQAAQITKMLFRRDGGGNMCIDDPDFIKKYYRTLYDISKPDMSKPTKELIDFVKAGSFPDVARQYRLIKQDAINVLVPYAPMMKEFERLCNEADKIGLTTAWIRNARLLAISLYRPKPDDMVWDSLIPVKTGERKIRGEGDWFIYAVKEHYHPQLGLVPSGTLNVWIG